jgi:hypothetical protein
MAGEAAPSFAVKRAIVKPCVLPGLLAYIFVGR